MNAVPFIKFIIHNTMRLIVGNLYDNKLIMNSVNLVIIQSSMDEIFFVRGTFEYSYMKSCKQQTILRPVFKESSGLRHVDKRLNGR